MGGDRIRVAHGCERPKGCSHVKVFGKPNVFAGWPFNCGFNQYGDGDEMVVGYTRHVCRAKKQRDGGVAYPVLDGEGSGASRTTDGGRTWHEEAQGYPGRLSAGGMPIEEARGMGDVAATPINPFCADHGLFCGADHVYTTLDRGRTWTGPSFLPNDGAGDYRNRPVYLVRPDGVLLTFPTVPNREGKEGRIFVYASYDGGAVWTLLSIMAQNPDYMNIMPTAVNLPSGRILASVRVQLTIGSAWTEMFDSSDGGMTWRFLGRLNDHGMPCQLARLADGRIAAVYGYRLSPYGVRARISEDDDGWRWGPELVLRDDGESPDLGYPRGGVASDGALVVCYYFHERRYPKPADCDKFHWGTRSIWATRLAV